MNNNEAEKTFSSLQLEKMNMERKLSSFGFHGEYPAWVLSGRPHSPMLSCIYPYPYRRVLGLYTLCPTPSLCRKVTRLSHSFCRPNPARGKVSPRQFYGDWFFLINFHLFSLKFLSFCLFTSVLMTHWKPLETCVYRSPSKTAVSWSSVTDIFILNKKF